MLYQIFDWPQKAKSNLIIVSIANTLDLPERLQSARVASRIGHARLLFKPYTSNQLCEIIQTRLANQPNIFSPDAVAFISRKVSSVAGDARRALDGARLACDVAIDENSKTVTMQHGFKAVQQLFGGGSNASVSNQIMKTLSKVDRIVMNSMLNSLKQNGGEETLAGEVWRISLAHFLVDSINSIGFG